MFKMFPVNTNVRTTNIKVQYTTKVFGLSEIYKTKASSCSSCGGGRK
jgi:hypothetical protein